MMDSMTKTILPIIKCQDSLFMFNVNLISHILHKNTTSTCSHIIIILFIILALSLEQDIPDYDMDSADEMWVESQNRLDLTPFKFEQMMDRLEKNTGQTVITLNEAKALLKQNDEVSVAVFDYWLNKRLKTVSKRNVCFFFFSQSQAKYFYYLFSF